MLHRRHLAGNLHAIVARSNQSDVELAEFALVF
jgi:hypothetical protein